MGEPRSMGKPPAADTTLFQTSSRSQPLMSMFQIPGTATDPKSLGLSKWPEIEPLLDKAIDSPSVITQEEKHQIAEWIPSRDEMDARCRHHLNRSLDELFKVAATDKDSLTYPDCLMLVQGFNLLSQLDHTGRSTAKMRRSRLHPEIQQKQDQAMAAVLPDIELQAIKNATNPGFVRQKQQPYFDRQDRELREAQSRPAPWIQRIIDQGNDISWGFVIYCFSLDDSEDWRTFRYNFGEGIRDIPMVDRGAETIRDKKVADLLTFDGPEDDFDRLRENFRALREKEKLKPGVLPHIFLYVSSECRNSWSDAVYTWLWAVDPDWSQDGPDEDGYDGKVAVNWGIAYSKFYNFMSMNTFSLKDIWKDLNQMRQHARGPIPGWAMTKLDQPVRVWPDI